MTKNQLNLKDVANPQDVSHESPASHCNLLLAFHGIVSSTLSLIIYIPDKVIPNTRLIANTWCFSLNLGLESNNLCMNSPKTGSPFLLLSIPAMTICHQNALGFKNKTKITSLLLKDYWQGKAELPTVFTNSWSETNQKMHLSSWCQNIVFQYPITKLAEYNTILKCEYKRKQWMEKFNLQIW